MPLLALAFSGLSPISSDASASPKAKKPATSGQPQENKVKRRHPASRQGGSSPARDRGKHHSTAAGLNGSYANVWGLSDASGADENSTPAGTRAFRARSFLPACPGNTIRIPGRDAMCPRALDQCRRRGEPDSFLVWTFVGPLNVREPRRSEWTPTGARCVRSLTLPNDQPLPVLTAADFRRLPLPPGQGHVQPSNRPVLINYPIILYVDVQPVLLTTTVLGAAVEVEALPASYTWTFGDGGTLTSAQAGGPYPDMTNTHTYTRPGRREVHLTTTYSGRYRVSGSTEWLPIAGTAQVTSAPVALEVIETRAVLVP
ncbi:MAG: PKD domain-containing protein [Kineosporiaceae bacterium]